MSRQGCRRRWGFLGLFSTPLLGAVTYGQGYKLSFLACPIRHFTGVPCPTCGMTRSFTAVAQGHWGPAINFHLFGPALFVVLSGTVLHLAVELATRQRYSTVYTQLINRRSFQIVSLCIYLGYYWVRLVWLGYPDEF
ncbi:DUF2752 domain-containing protein [Acaryochloris thomasi]|uniref:DUF2752 domain-containing protein n=1 Tax=Acaryochloris thomasi TaxID=2929456 RepID=UPI001F48B187|nr:DUF2752 domain-containing protein [Acaryochloris thomasi]